MRFKNTAGPLKVYIVAGTQTVLISLAIAKYKVQGKNFLGFSIKRKDSKGKTISLNGSKRFPSLANTAKEKFSLVQSFFWKDYTADPGQTYTYTIQAMLGKVANPTAAFEVSIAVTTEPLLDGDHSVFFNYGVTGSQAYSNRFPNEKLSDLPQKKQEQALSMLGRELWNDGLLRFVRQAKDNTYSLYAAFYELQYPEFLAALLQIKEGGAGLQIIYSAKPGQKEKNEAAIKAAGLEACCTARTKVNQPHNKFMVLCKDDKPIEVFTGSTNITIQAIFGHSNTGHWVRDADVAKQYLDYWKCLQPNPATAAAARVCETLQADADLGLLKKGTHVFFSPRASDQLLSHYAQLVDAAEKMVCMILPFNIDDRFREVYARDKDYLRYILFEKAAEARSVHSNDRDLMITGGAILQTPLEQWVKEISTKTTTGAGILYVHNKFFLIDPLETTPVVVTGSANFSKSSITSNDENTIVVKGNRRVADIYLTEFSRMFEHFWPRYLAGLSKEKGFSKPLDESYTWFNDYFDKEKLGYKRKQVFNTMKQAKPA